MRRHDCFNDIRGFGSVSLTQQCVVRCVRFSATSSWLWWRYFGGYHRSSASKWSCQSSACFCDGYGLLLGYGQQHKHKQMLPEVWRRKEVGCVSLGRNVPRVTPSHVEWASGSSALWECWTHELHKSTFKQQSWWRHASWQLPLGNVRPLWPHLAALWGGDERKVASKLLRCLYVVFNEDRTLTKGMWHSNGYCFTVAQQNMSCTKSYQKLYRSLWCQSNYKENKSVLMNT